MTADTAAGGHLTSEALRVGVIADMVGQAGGIGRYTTELVVALGRRDDIRLIVAAPASAAELLQRIASDNLETHLVVPDRGSFPPPSGSGTRAVGSSSRPARSSCTARSTSCRAARGPLS